VDWLAGIFDSISSALSNVTVYLIQIVGYLQAALAYVWEVLQAVANWLLAAVQKIGAWLKNLWQGGFKGLFGRLLNLYKQVHDWLELRLRPIIDFLKNVKAWWDRYYRQHILPMINLIQKIRRYLLILRLLHVKFATTLDNWLLKYEQALNKIFGTVHGALNQIIDWLNLATNPTGLGRLVLVSVATRRTIGAITRAVTGLPLGHFFPYNGPGAFAFERQPMTAADYTDPDRNPPPSIILAPLLSFMTDAELDPNQVVSDADIDATETLPWGGTFIANVVAAEEYAANYQGDDLSILALIENQAGELYTAGTGAAASLAALWQ
jgi:hypothetical protein